ncbi:MAG: class I SAM-dependent methyltransferase [Planctomycetota bacterium]|jgi:2-polyprenyl-3-methyl-5-hydroxy-6-metoxy-1,4-benzoquinol methylase
MGVPEALQDQNLRRFRLRRHRLSVAGGQLSVVVPARANDLIDPGRGAAPGHPDELPYWADIWHASLGIARHLMRGPGLLGQRVLDLGCGIGLAGLAAGRRGAVVRFVDRDPDALHFARFNAADNGVRGFSATRLDWFEATVDGEFDLVLMADVAYDRRHFEPLLRHLRCCLAPGGAAVVGDPYRDVADEFVAMLGSRFDVNITHTDTFFAGRRVPLRLVHMAASEAPVKAPE